MIDFYSKLPIPWCDLMMQIDNLSIEGFKQSSNYDRKKEISFGFIYFFFLFWNMRSYLGTLFKAVIHKINIKPKECNQIITLKVFIRLYRLWQKHSFINIGGWTICLFRIAFVAISINLKNAFLSFSFVHGISFPNIFIWGEENAKNLLNLRYLTEVECMMLNCILYCLHMMATHVDKCLTNKLLGIFFSKTSQMLLK